ncbi:MAG: hypothetical protein OM95_03970 [Bdellovibrio sp. ArHS]|uniref:DUF6580 family putative transport protein n=1 Tax=Bdellovibrio sp. ArHS TaxID=1569284 RepID=UPI00058366AC|nr:DUF6580 family putative transport protein [Bdellovibrio sp. ArHS]KHD89297.1 MAG: hypothetical protein OM95_03970 [Bdellovibrio sp. ArHS]
MKTTQWMTLVLMVLVAAFSRLIPHPWNFTAIGAMALFGGTYFPSKKLSMVIPLAALFISDLVLGFHTTMLYVYVGFLVAVVLGWNLREQKSVVRVGTMSLVTSAVFFLISNFGVWMMEGLYAKNLTGLVSCYVAAIPFLDNQILGDLFFSAVLFGGYEAVKKFAPDFAVQTQA